MVATALGSSVRGASKGSSGSSGEVRNGDLTGTLLTVSAIGSSSRPNTSVSSPAFTVAQASADWMSAYGGNNALQHDDLDLDLDLAIPSSAGAVYAASVQDHQTEGHNPTGGMTADLAGPDVRSPMDSTSYGSVHATPEAAGFPVALTFPDAMGDHVIGALEDLEDEDLVGDSTDEVTSTCRPLEMSSRPWYVMSITVGCRTTASSNPYPRCLN